jgi:DNA-binding CsgD family transcriptional regulator
MTSSRPTTFATSKDSPLESSTTNSDAGELTFGPNSTKTPSPTSSQSPGNAPRSTTRPADSPSRPTPTESADFGSLTGTGLNSKTLAGERTKSSRPSPSTPRPAMENVTWASLSPRGKAILRTVAIPLSLGCSKKEVAAALRISPSSVGQLLDELADELGGDGEGFAFRLPWVS